MPSFIEKVKNRCFSLGLFFLGLVCFLGACFVIFYLLLHIWITLSTTSLVSLLI